eukprot:COSAG05_NODE_3186_length_2259_cov_8.301389_2_plen_362_part_00
MEPHRYTKLRPLRPQGAVGWRDLPMEPTAVVGKEAVCPVCLRAPAAADARPVAFLLAPQQPATGNAATAERFAAILSSYGLRVQSRDPASMSSFAKARCPPLGEGGAAVVADEAGASLIVALHGIKSALMMVGSSAPMIVVTGGTDVNVDVATDTEKAQAMARVLRAPNTVAVVSFSQDMADAMHRLLDRTAAPDGSDDGVVPPPCHIIPQGVSLPPAERGVSASIQSEVERALAPALLPGESLDVVGPQKLLLLVAGLRPVKDVLYLAGVARVQLPHAGAPCIPATYILRLIVLSVAQMLSIRRGATARSCGWWWSAGGSTTTTARLWKHALSCRPAPLCCCPRRSRAPAASTPCGSVQQ